MITEKRTYIIELDDQLFRTDSESLEKIANLKEVDGDCIFVSDMGETVSSTTLVEANIKYVDLMTQKNLQEAGEFDEPVSVIPLWKKKKSKNSTEICFTALPARLFLNYNDQIRANDNAILLIPLYTVLLDVLNKVSQGNPIAVTFMHDRFIDIIIGTKSRILYSGRCVAFDTSPEQIEVLWNTVKTDIENVESENRVEITDIVHLDWIDSLPPPEWIKKSKPALRTGKTEPVSINGEKHEISFLKALKETPSIKSISPPVEKIAYYTRRYTPQINILFLLFIMICLACFFGFNKKSHVIKSRISELEQTISEFEKRKTSGLSEKDSEETLSFIQSLSFSRKAPGYKKVINQISNAFSSFAFSDIKLREIKVDYNADIVSIEISGKITAPFDTAYNGFQGVVSKLRAMEYSIDKSSFGTKIRTSNFLLNISKRIK